MLEFDGDTIQRIAKEHNVTDASLMRIFLTQAWWEMHYLLTRKSTFRKRQNQNACHAYSSMTSDEFEAINLRQYWANWRTIPKSLSGVIPDSPIFAIDLCCGSGTSTEVLCCYLPYGSRILGLEYNPAFVNRARSKMYFHQTGQQFNQVSFRAQSVLEPFCDENGALIPTGSVDLVNSSGAVGCHFMPEATTKLAVEIARVLKPGGIANIDSGTPGTNKHQVVELFQAAGFTLAHSTKSCLLDRYTQVSLVRH